MKKLIRAAAAILAVVLTVPMFGCSVFNVFSVDSLIKAPRLTGDNAEIQKAFESAVGSEVSLVRPVAGEYRSAYVLHDYDGDGVNEAIVFYMPKDTAGEVRMHFLKYSETERKWNSVTDVKGNGSDVHSITFCNFDRDSVAEIAVAWAFADGQKDKMLTVYRYSDTENSNKKDFVSLASVRISDFNFIDVDFDGADELLYTIIDPASEKPTAQFKSLKYDIATERFVPLSEVQLDSRIVSLVSYSHDMRAGNYRFYIDAQLSDGRYMTEIVFYDYSRSAFVRPVDENGIPLGEMTLRRPYILSDDINSDGSVEVPRCELYEKSEVLSPKEGSDSSVFATEYYNFNGEKLISVGMFYICDELGIRIDLAKYRSTAYIRFDRASGSILFYSYPVENVIGDRLLFTVSSVPAVTTDYGSAAADTSEEKQRDKAQTHTVITQAGRELGITPDSVEADIQPIKTER